ncbi:MAG: helix-turn-helix transcriptional regulator [Oscillospiraceae bacterium]|nr:helix-turn-helix transcriptional regulator [Oscillospiraceae bacterium]
MVLPITEAERIKRQMSRDDLANALSVSKRTISNWQSGVTELPLSKLLAIAQMWNCTTDAIRFIGWKSLNLITHGNQRR